MTIINEYRNYINELVENFGFGMVLEDINKFFEWRRKFYDDLCEAGYQVCSGYCRAVIFHEDWDYVLKFTYNQDKMYDKNNEYLGELDYCANEAFVYQEALKVGLADYFAECICIGQVGEINFYLMTRCDCDEDRVYSGSCDAAFRVFCEENGYDHEHASNAVYDEFDDYYCDDDDNIFEFAREQWGSVADRVKNFCSEMGVNDIHCGNWGFLGEQLIIIDYAGYGYGARMIANYRGVAVDHCY